MRFCRFLRTSSSGMLESIGGIYPGCTEFALIPSFPYLTAVALVNNLTEPLEALYAGCPLSPPTNPIIDDILTMEPPPVVCICGTACFVPRNTPVELIFMIRSQFSKLLGSSTLLLLTPALLTSISNLPNLETAVSIAETQSASTVTSKRTNRAWPPDSSISASSFLP